MSNQTSTLRPALTFKTAVLFRRAATDGGLWVQMMPGVFSTAEALADGIKTHKALAREAFVYMPVDVALDDKGSPVTVEPIRATEPATSRKITDRLTVTLGLALEEIHNPGTARLCGYDVVEMAETDIREATKTFGVPQMITDEAHRRARTKAEIAS